MPEVILVRTPQQKRRRLSKGKRRKQVGNQLEGSGEGNQRGDHIEGEQT